MLSFEAVRNDEITFVELVAGLSRDDLRDLTNEMVDTMLGLITDCVDADVVFAPVDPDADDPFAATEEEVHLAWNLGHVIVHTTASAEESAALAAELARGVENHTPCLCSRGTMPHTPSDSISTPQGRNLALQLVLLHR